MARFLVLVFLLTSRVTQSFTHPMDPTFHRLLCQQCNSWCPFEQGVSQDSPRIGKAGPRGPIGPPGQAGPPGPHAIVNMTAIEELIDRKIKEALRQSHGTSRPETTESPKSPVTSQSCQDVSLETAKSRNETGGVFDIEVPEIGLKEVYCDVETDGGDWVVFQRRMDGSVDFNRAWNEYVGGFGDVDKEFWLGLEIIHQMTKTGRHELRFDMIARDGTHYYAKYTSFKVGPASDNYRLNVSGYSGNATDSLANPSYSSRVHNGMSFATRDRDHDGTCGASNKGGWWFNACFHSFLNGEYNRRVMWYHQTRGTWIYMKFAEMKFRLKP